MIHSILTGILLVIPLQADEASSRELLRRYQESHAARQSPASELDGKTLIVRLCTDAQNAPDEFSLLRVQFEGGRVAIKPDGTTVPFVVVLTPEDQEDDAVKAAIGDHVGAWRVAQELRLRLPFLAMPYQEPQQYEFLDALGEPLGGATVEISLAEHGGPRIPVGRRMLDNAGRLAATTLVGNLRMACFTVFHADYGCAEAGQFLGVREKITVPLVRKNTTAAERAICGRIVDPNGEPVAGATIHCLGVRTLGEGLIDSLDESRKGITDANGAFSFYLPNRRSRDNRGELIPPKSKYQVRIDAPKSLGLLPYAKPIENGRDTLVVLERGDRMRRLRFEDPNGPISDPARLETITVVLRMPDGSALVLHYDDWRQGAPLIPGVYLASMRRMHEQLQFEPVQVTRDGPEEVVFRLPSGATYQGRVVHGLTGRPMPGALVLAMNGSSGQTRLCELTAGQWEALHAMTNDPPGNDPAIAPLRNVYGVTRLVRADATGAYRIALKGDEPFYGFVVLEQEYLAAVYREYAFKADANRVAEVPTIKLFPAATVFVEAATDKEHLPVIPRWVVEEESRSGWVEELLGLDNGQESSLDYSYSLKLNARQPVHVPAGVSLRLRLDTPYNEEFCPVLIPQTIRLMQGETADLGRFTFEPAIPVQVRITDSAGRTVEGIPVRKLYVDRDRGNGWSVPHNTDEQGVARFHAAANSTGTFGVLYHGPNGVHLKETLDYRIDGSEDAEREFVLQLSDDMLTHLLK